ncbi:cytochrome-c oxidase [uncultured Campylobacter sp.]|uniref:cytochrome-c oxidase n=1 Tax=uncultured Campylobacter sp. TaxID=218934 RepID=UPI00260307AF|nr:cytochrome-c oxidase [uncultured Campylobacter sp.]
MKKFRSLLLCAAVAATLSAQGESSEDKVEKITSIDIYVSPFYSAKEGKPEYVHVYEPIDDLLMKNDVPSLKKAIKIIEDAPDMVAPTTLMTVAARAYDLGLKDDAVFWFYAGKYRFISFASVIDVSGAMFMETVEANSAFMHLAGDVINPYAFCDIDKQQIIVEKAVDWVKDHPYKAIFSDKFPSMASDRKAALKEVIEKFKADQQKQKQYFADPKNRADYIAERKKYRTDERFCD